MTTSMSLLSRSAFLFAIILFSFLPATAQSVEAGNDALVAAYSFDAGSGPTVADVSGNGHTGTIANALWSAAGQPGSGGALSFDGAGDWVTIADSAALDFTTGMSLQAWVRPSAFSGWRTVLLKETGGGFAYALYAHDNAPRPAGYLNIAGDQSVTGSAQLALNTWTHLAMTFDGTTMRLYVNGTQVGTRAISGAILISTGVLRIGGNNVWGEYFSGLIDNVRIHSRALTPEEIQSLMNTPVGVQQPGFEIVAYNPVLTVGQSDSVTFNFELTPLGGFTGPTVPSISGLPSGATPAFQPPEGPPHPGPFSLTVLTGTMTPPGTYTLTIGSTSGSLSATKDVTLVVTGAPDFRVIAEPNSLTVTQGLTGTANFQIERLNGYSGILTMSATGLPTGVTTTYTPSSLVPPGAGTVQFNVGPAAPPGVYTVQITASDGALTQQAAFTLTVLLRNTAGSWEQVAMGNTPASFYGVIEGNIDNIDNIGNKIGSSRHVIASGGNGLMYDYVYNGAIWSVAPMPVGQVSDGEMHNMAIGPGRRDGINRLYIAAALSGKILEVSLVNGGWQSALVATLSGSTDIIIGDGRNDGVMRMYVSWMSGMTEFTRVGDTWQPVTISSNEGGWVHGIDLGQPLNDGVNRLVTANQGNGDVYLNTYILGPGWTKTLIDAVGTG